MCGPLMKWALRSFVCLCGLIATSAGASADDDVPEATDETEMTWNIPTWTLGGKQFWTDTLIHGRWRIQRHVLSGHHRLLDPSHVRRAWGSWDQCLSTWETLKQEKEVEPLHKKVVILIHGLGRSRASMKELAQYLERESDYSVLSFSYASTRAALSDDANCLEHVIHHLDGVEEVSFVAHSMGNLVVRYYLGNQLANQAEVPPPFRYGRFVMLAPPNNGAAMARRFKDNPIFKLIFATGGRQFTEEWERVQQHLVTPSFPFGIIAGGNATHSGGNPLLEGDDDLVVTVEETRLPGASDFAVLPVLHTFIMDDPTVQQFTLRFLQHGYFVSEDRRQPILQDELPEGRER